MAIIDSSRLNDTTGLKRTYIREGKEDWVDPNTGRLVQGPPGYSTASIQDLIDTFVATTTGEATGHDPVLLQAALSQRAGLGTGYAWHNDSIRQNVYDSWLQPDPSVTPEQRAEVQKIQQYTQYALGQVDSGNAQAARGMFPGASQDAVGFTDVNTSGGGLGSTIGGMAKDVISELGPFALAVAGGYGLSYAAFGAPTVAGAATGAAGGAGAAGASGAASAYDLVGPLTTQGLATGIGTPGYTGTLANIGGVGGAGLSGLGYAAPTTAAAGGTLGGISLSNLATGYLGGNLGATVGGGTTPALGAAGGATGGAAGAAGAAGGIFSGPLGQQLTEQFPWLGTVGNYLSDPLLQGLFGAGLGFLNNQQQNDALSSAVKNYQAGIQGASESITNFLSPYNEAGLEGLNRYQNLRRDPSSITQNPWYQFKLDQGLENIQRQKAQQGLLQSGNTLAELADWTGNQYLEPAYNNELSRDLPLMEIGTRTADTMARSLADLAIQGGAVGAQREVGQGSQDAAFLQNLGRYLGSNFLQLPQTGGNV